MFKKDGRCRFGDSCRYKHVKRNKIAAKNNDSTSKICPLFISKEGKNAKINSFSLELSSIFSRDLSSDLK